MSESQIKFLQLSDALFDSPAALESLELSPLQRRERTEEGFLALERALALASEEKVHAVLIVGNLFHGPSVSPATIARLQSVFGQLRQVPIIIAPGEFDCWSSTCMYSPHAAGAPGKWPSNVYVFSKPEHVTIRLPACAGVTITSRPFVDGVQPPAIEPERLAALQLEDFPIKILMKPFSKVDAKGGETENISRSFSFIAGGGSADCRLEQVQGKAAVAFSGSLFGQSVDDIGQRAALIATLDGDHSNVNVSIEKHELDLRRVVSATVDLTNQESDRHRDLVERELSLCGARENRDIVVLRLIGLHEVDRPVRIDAENLRSRFYHLKFENLSRPDYDRQAVSPTHSEGQFLEFIEQLKADKTTADSQQLVDDCKYLGLAALRQGRIRLGDAT